MLNARCKKAEVVEVIKVVVIEGTGDSKDDPIKQVTQYWSKDGEFLFSGIVNESQNLHPKSVIY